jgi:hypothetical protein
MQPLEENVVQINCLRKNANGSQFASSSDSVCIETLTSMNQMATAELIKISKPEQSRGAQTVVVDAAALPCFDELEIRPLKKIRIRECGDLRHWWDEEKVMADESIECA